MTGSPPQSISLKVALEDCVEAKAGEIISASELRIGSGRAGRLFSSGANNVRYEGVMYRKGMDVASFDNGVAVRELSYFNK